MKGKVALIHQTGTGKSFIGFKLLEDFHDKIIVLRSKTVGA